MSNWLSTNLAGGNKTVLDRISIFFLDFGLNQPQGRGGLFLADQLVLFDREVLQRPGEKKKQQEKQHSE